MSWPVAMVRVYGIALSPCEVLTWKFLLPSCLLLEGVRGCGSFGSPFEDCRAVQCVGHQCCPCPGPRGCSPGSAWGTGFPLLPGVV